MPLGEQQWPVTTGKHSIIQATALQPAYYIACFIRCTGPPPLRVPPPAGFRGWACEPSPFQDRQQHLHWSETLKPSNDSFRALLWLQPMPLQLQSRKFSCTLISCEQSMVSRWPKLPIFFADIFSDQRRDVINRIPSVPLITFQTQIRSSPSLLQHKTARCLVQSIP